MTAGQRGLKDYMYMHQHAYTHNEHTSVKPLMYCHCVMAPQGLEHKWLSRSYKRQHCVFLFFFFYLLFGE